MKRKITNDTPANKAIIHLNRAVKDVLKQLSEEEELCSEPLKSRFKNPYTGEWEDNTLMVTVRSMHKLAAMVEASSVLSYDEHSELERFEGFAANLLEIQASDIAAYRSGLDYPQVKYASGNHMIDALLSFAWICWNSRAQLSVEDEVK